MDSRVSVRFYTVLPMQAGQPSFDACLNKIIGLGSNVVRSVDDAVVQVSSLRLDGDRFSGDLIRFQDENLPSLVKKKGLKPEKLSLPTEAGLGHHTAFVYDKSIRVLTYQITRNAVPLGRFNGYVAAACSCPMFGFLPVLSASDLKQLNAITPKTMLIKVADPDSLDALEDGQRKLKNALRNLRTLADGVYVKVQVGLANNRGQLDKGSVGNLVSWLLEQRLTKKGKIGTVQVSGKTITDGDVDLDFINSQLGDSTTLKLGAAGQDENYKARLEFLTECLDKHYSTLKKFKPKD